MAWPSGSIGCEFLVSYIRRRGWTVGRYRSPLPLSFHSTHPPPHSRPIRSPLANGKPTKYRVLLPHGLNRACAPIFIPPRLLPRAGCLCNGGRQPVGIHPMRLGRRHVCLPTLRWASHGATLCRKSSAPPASVFGGAPSTTARESQRACASF